MPPPGPSLPAVCLAAALAAVPAWAGPAPGAAGSPAPLILAQADPGGSGSEPIGERPESVTAERVSLREQGALLGAGETTVELGLSYSRAERDSIVAPARVEQRLATASLALRQGVGAGLQFTARLPYSYLRDTVVTPDQRDTDASGELGDVSLSLLGSVLNEGVGRPNVVLALDAILPAGAGDRGAGASVILSKSLDPVVLFASGSYLYGFDLEPEDPDRLISRHNVGLGLGYAFAINDTVALSTLLLGNYRSAETAPGDLPGSRESYLLEFGLTARLARGLFVEPTVGIGVGGSSPDLTLGISLPYTF